MSCLLHNMQRSSPSKLTARIESSPTRTVNHEPKREFAPYHAKQVMGGSKRAVIPSLWRQPRPLELRFTMAGAVCGGRPSAKREKGSPRITHCIFESSPGEPKTSKRSASYSTPCSMSAARRESAPSNLTACMPTSEAALQLMPRSSTNRHSCGLAPSVVAGMR